MLLTVPDLLSPDQVAKARQLLDAADWVDGKVTAGPQSAKAKDNSQIPEGHPAARGWPQPPLPRGGPAASGLSTAI
jgi:PKHD-type hydroxylase